MNAPAVTEYRILLPITKPLTQNEVRRLHWAAKARRIKEIRTAIGRLAKTKPYKIPELGRCTVQLEYRQRVNRRIDGDALAPTQKACVDGLIDAGVCKDDSHEYVTHLPVVILPPVPREQAAIWLVVRPLDAEDAA